MLDVVAIRHSFVAIFALDISKLAVFLLVAGRLRSCLFTASSQLSLDQETVKSHMFRDGTEDLIS